jgi:hypothetical protein
VSWLQRRGDYRDAGRHRRASRRPRTVEMVDARTLQAHFLTDEALDAGRRGAGRYVALCGRDVLPASLTVAQARYCTGCVAS